jgi:chemotaxis family two-component system response regulator PixG
MMSEDVTPNALIQPLDRYKQQQFTGQVKLSPPGDSHQTWSFFFCLGRLFWVDDGKNDNRRTLRLLQAACPSVKQKRFALREGDAFAAQNYSLLMVLLHRRVLSQELFFQVVNGVIAEALFDLLWQTGGTTQVVNEQPYDPLDVLKMASVTVKSHVAVTQAAQDWASWQAAQLMDLHPDWALTIRDPDQLRERLTPEVYQKLVRAIDGQRTVRDLALLMRRDLVPLMRSLVPYIRRKIIDLQPIADLPPLVFIPAVGAEGSARAAERRQSAPAANVPIATVACIDDSPQVCAAMSQIIEQAGYIPLCIQDSTQALTILLERKPKLIFLDLIMPVANGYEICAQIRRVAVFKDIPIAILTGSDGIIDRVRAKVVGATDFVSKPIEDDKILSLIHKYVTSTPAKANYTPPPNNSNLHPRTG